MDLRGGEKGKDLPPSWLADLALIQQLDVRDAFNLVKISRFYGLQQCLPRGSAHTPLRRRGYPTLLHIDQEHHTFEGAKGADHRQQQVLHDLLGVAQGTYHLAHLIEGLQMKDPPLQLPL